MRRKLLLVEREKAAGRRDAIDALGDQLVRRVGEALEQVAIVQRVDHLVRHRAAHDLVLHRERPGLRIADVAVEALETCIEHQDADRYAVVDAIGAGHHGRAASVSEPMAAEASAASNSPVSLSASGCSLPAKRSIANASIGILGAPSSIISASV